MVHTIGNANERLPVSVIVSVYKESSYSHKIKTLNAAQTNFYICFDGQCCAGYLIFSKLSKLGKNSFVILYRVLKGQFSDIVFFRSTQISI